MALQVPQVRLDEFYMKLFALNEHAQDCLSHTNAIHRRMPASTTHEERAVVPAQAAARSGKRRKHGRNKFYMKLFVWDDTDQR
jgi:hypothetical protein